MVNARLSFEAREMLDDPLASDRSGNGGFESRFTENKEGSPGRGGCLGAAVVRHGRIYHPSKSRDVSAIDAHYPASNPVTHVVVRSAGKSNRANKIQAVRSPSPLRAAPTGA